MNIEIWSDVVCPWCYIGKRRFERALASFGHPGEAEVGAGEVSLGPVAGAVGNAVADAVGVRVRVLPLTREQVTRAIEES